MWFCPSLIRELGGWTGPTAAQARGHEPTLNSRRHRRKNQVVPLVLNAPPPGPAGSSRLEGAAHLRPPRLCEHAQCLLGAAAGSSFFASYWCKRGTNQRNSSKTPGVTENREPTEYSEKGTGGHGSGNKCAFWGSLNRRPQNPSIRG